MNISFSKLWILVVQKVGRIVNDPHFFNKSQKILESIVKLFFIINYLQSLKEGGIYSVKYNLSLSYRPVSSTKFRKYEQYELGICI